MLLRDIRDLIASLELSKNCYMAKLPDNMEEAIGVYHLNRQVESHHAIGGVKSYGIMPISMLIHWNKNPTQTEQAAIKLYNALDKMREVTINEQTIILVRLLQPHPVDVGTDDKGIYEMVIEAEFYYERRA